MDLSFSGAGFMGCYYFGVVNCWNKYIPRERVRRVAGASAGSLTAAYYLMDLPLDACLQKIIELTEDVRSRPLGVFDRSNQIVDVLPRTLDKMFPEDAHKRVSGRLFVHMTRLRDMKGITVSEFETRQDLIDALNCSCFIPVWSGNHVSTYKGVKHIDGGFTNNLPVFDEHTIRICCFSGASDIAPYDRSQADFMSGSFQGMPFNFNWKNMRRGRRALWPPPPSYIMELLERGFHDAKDFILSNDLIQCNNCYRSAELECQPIYAKIAPTISPSVSRSASYENLAGVGDLESSGSSFEKSFNNSSSSNNNNNNKRASMTDSYEAPPSSSPAGGHKQRASSMATVESSGIFERRRSKSGKQITLESLELASQVKHAAQALASGNKSFVSKLRDKLQRRHTQSSLGTTNTGTTGSNSSDRGRQLEPVGHVHDRLDDNDDELLDDRDGAPPASAMPTIIIEQAILEAKAEATNADDTSVRQISAILELDTSDEIEPDSGPVERHSPVKLRQQRRQDSTSTASSIESASSLDADSTGDGGSSADSAVGLRERRGPAQGALVRTKTRSGSCQSPSDMFLASRRESVVMAHQLNAELERQQQLQPQKSSLVPGRFSFAPSPLPSCPPSPNLNRHCTECIRMRQEARLDGIDESIKREAEKYGSLGGKEPEKEFNTIKYKLSNWFRQFGGTKYFYSFDADNDSGNMRHSGRRGSKAPQASPNRRASEIPNLS